MKYHPICSSSFLSRSYLDVLFGDSLSVVPESTLLKRQFLVAQLSLLDSYCVLVNSTVNTSLSLFLRQQFITAQVLTSVEFYDQINATIYRLVLDISLSLRHSLDYIQSVTHGNAIMSTYVSNWQFLPSSPGNSSIINMRPVRYGNCSCARSAHCSLPIIIHNITFPGLAIGCLPSSVLLQSTLECFYNQTCIDTLHDALFDNVTISSLPTSINMSSRFPPYTLVGSLFDKLFIEEWVHQNDYEKFFRICAVSTCTYTYIQESDILYVITTVIGLFGGLSIVFRLVCPLLIIGSIYLIDFIQNKSSTQVQE